MKNKILTLRDREQTKVKFKEDPLPYTVMAASNRYAVCSRKLSKSMDGALLKFEVQLGSYLSFKEAYDELKKAPVYTIIDFKRKVRSTNNLVFNNYDYSLTTGCLQTIVDLMDGKIELSHRNEAPLNIVDL